MTCLFGLTTQCILSSVNSALRHWYWQWLLHHGHRDSIRTNRVKILISVGLKFQNLGLVTCQPPGNMEKRSQGFPWPSEKVSREPFQYRSTISSSDQKLSFSCFLTNPQYGCLMHSDGHGEVWTDWNDMSKFFQYGWRCTTNENSYSNRTLMGNWNQERYDLQKIVQPQPLPSQVILLPLLPLASPISREECVVVLGGRIYNPSTPQFNWTLPFLLINDSEDTMQFLIKLDKTLILSTNSVSGLFTHSWNTSVS
ncbi:UPF0686 protein C11orf1 homolog isoform X1 [Vombatus ursinus]|uniref:UPF0686 protein C11orf1 homolog isoform X1 n=1 Tax=Vombatus ursinus TaxID=29139 RepID=UPI000FFD6E61|nr:UPF0686 protein C11orf1 homolog isoform X1 [Vombatus ursinus]